MMIHTSFVNVLKEVVRNNECFPIPVLAHWLTRPLEGPGVCGFLHAEAGIVSENEALVEWRFQGWRGPSR